MNQTYTQTVAVLLEIAPSVFRSTSFAMKGGTALNLFVQDMPRLSVDIDVVFCDHAADREQALAQIANELTRIKLEIESMGYVADIKKTKTGDEVKMFVSGPNAEVKIEVNFVFRGTVLPIQKRSLTKKTQETFSTNIEIPTLSPSEIYGSKLVAAMDRQHPRDIFDIKKMYESHGLTPEIVDCFVVYLAGHNRPIHEVLFPNLQMLDVTFKNEFVGMTSEEISIEELVATRAKLMAELPAALHKEHIDFLLSLVKADPDWSKMPYSHLKDLPALKWKTLNLKNLQAKNPKQFEFQYAELKRRLESSRGASHAVSW